MARWEMSHAQTRTQAVLHALSSVATPTVQPMNILAQRSSSEQVSLLDALAPTLAPYLASYGQNVGVEVYDMTHQRAYGLNNTLPFLTASSIKVPIMLTFLAMTESQGRVPNANEMSLLTAMIEHSDNDAASALFGEINGARGISAFFQQNGLSGLTPDQDAWGYSQITPQAMVNLLIRLQNGTILNATDRATALRLMEQVEVDQQWGVGNTAPAGATFAMKNGWVPGPDGLWSVNTSGIVQTKDVTYIISVYTQEQPSLANGQAIVQQVCSDIAAALA
jgi:beta-lactamase class A